MATRIRFDDDSISRQRVRPGTMRRILSVSTVLTLVLVLAAMFYLSWQIAVVALVMVPFFLLPARLLARRLQRLTREGMRLDADISALMSERFNVSGAMLAKLY